MIVLPRNRSRSIKEQLALLPNVDRDRILGNMTREALKALKGSWRGWHARPAQVEPSVWRVKVDVLVEGPWVFLVSLNGRVWNFPVTAERGETTHGFLQRVTELWRAKIADAEAAGEWTGFVTPVYGDQALHLVSRDHNEPRVVVKAPEGAFVDVVHNVWRTWLVQAGRGFGKTRLGAQWAIEKARKYPRLPGALIGATPEEVGAVMINGNSGIMECSDDAFRPTYYPAKDGGQLVWPNDAKWRIFAGSNPQKLRGPNIGFAWVDELPKFAEAEETWRQLNMTLRAGSNPQCLITTTPVPKQVMTDVRGSPGVIVTLGSSFENTSLPESTIEQWTEMYGGTRFGRQELEGELLTDTQGALWTQAQVQASTIFTLPERYVVPTPDGQGRTEEFRILKIAVAVDPAVRAGLGQATLNAETGIMVGGLGSDGLIYVLADRSGDWTIADGSAAKRIVEAYKIFGADEVVIEQNNGGDWIPAVIRAVDPSVRIKLVVASKGKVTRAEPVAALYEQGKVRHVVQSVRQGLPANAWGTLFSQMTTWLPGEKSPDRMDALVWLCTHLAGIDSKRLGAGQRTGRRRSIAF